MAHPPVPDLSAGEAPEAGFGAQRALNPARLLTVSPGPVEGRTYLPDGSIGSVVALDLAEPLSVNAYAIAIINGGQHVLVADGPLAGTWLPVAGLTPGS